MAKIALLSDIHGNLTALEAVIEQLKPEQPDIWLCLGDIVGYGGQPAACIELIRELGMVCVKGNHDAGVTGELSIKHFRNPNRRLIELTRDKLLSKDQIEWLKKLPLIREGGDWVAAHASPVEPEKWKYLESAFTARAVLEQQEQRLCFIGHTHKSVLVSTKFGIREYDPSNKFLINPGSVGQPRDGDYRASCMMVDIDSDYLKPIRVKYEKEPELTALQQLGFSRNEAQHLLRA